MILLLARLVLVAGLFLATVAGAQEGGAPPKAIDYDAFGAAATKVEALVADPRATDDALETARTELSAWRAQLLAAQGANQTTVDRLQAQIDALGPVPAEGSGVTESAEITQRRAELAKQLADAQAPRATASEAFNRTDGLIAEIDSELRERQRQTLLQRGPSPLMPSSIAAAAKAVETVAGEIRTEVGQTNLDPATRAELRGDATVFAVLAVLGGALLIWGRRWVGGLSSLASRKRARDTVVFLVSLGQVLLPVLGAILVLVGIAATGIAGEKVSQILGGVISLLATTFAGLWLSGRLFPEDPKTPSAIDMPVSARHVVRRIAIAIGVIVGVGSVLTAIVAFEEVNEAARAVFLLPYFVVLGIAFWALANILTRATNEEAAVPAEDGTETEMWGETETKGFVSRFVAIIVTLLRVVAVAGPLLALSGFTNAADGLMRPTALSLGLLGLFLALQVPIRDLYALITRTNPEEAGRALLPVLVNFILAAAALPILALIWGMRRSEIDEVWSRFQEGIQLGGTRITPNAILTVVLVFALALLITRLVQGALKSTVLPRTKLDTGAQNAIAAGVGYVGIALAGLIAINAAGIDLTALAFVGAALSVGIGFGLRNVIENFVAGLILLIERPIGEGDWIEVGGNMGIVKQISVRSTVIETFDKQQLIVPNGDFITGTVTNWTRGSQVGRAVVTVGVGYGSDTRKVERILLEIAQEQPGVMSYPEPGVDFLGFGSDSLDFRVRAILYDVNTLGAVKTEIHHRILERFREEGIEIPFQQREIWLKNPEALAPRPPQVQRDPRPTVVPKGDGGGIEAAAEQDGEGDGR
jgi:small-conductance mechanosensitive channel